VYYTAMPNPKSPPISLRLPPAVMVEVDAWAEKAGTNRHAALVALIGKGLGLADAKAAAKVVQTPAAAPRPFVSRLKGQWKAP